MNHLQPMRFGSKRWRWDPRERGFSHKLYFGAADLSQIPRDGLRRPRRPIENQLHTLRCTGYAGAVGQGYIHGLRFHPDAQAALIGMRQGRSVDDAGSDPKSALKSLTDDGSLPWERWPAHLETDGVAATGMDRLTIPAGFDTRNYRALAYLGVDDAFDIFDDIRWALFKAYDPATKRGAVVHAFGRWFNEWSASFHGIIPKDDSYTSFAGYHNWLFIDWITIDGVLYLVAQNSGGTHMGDQGFFCFPREVVNREFSRWGTALKILKPMTREQIEMAKREDAIGRLQRLIIQAWNAISDLLPL